jgi:hypothetical protein
VDPFAQGHRRRRQRVRRPACLDRRHAIRRRARRLERKACPHGGAATGAGGARAQPALPGEKQDASQIAYTQAYLARFEAELPKAANAAALIDTMKAAYPQAGLMIALDIGAKVNKGEMKW